MIDIATRTRPAQVIPVIDSRRTHAPFELIRGQSKVVAPRAASPIDGSGKFIEGDPHPNPAMPLEHMRLGDQARLI